MYLLFWVPLFRRTAFFVFRTTQADYVAVLHEGRVAESGTYASLMSKDGGVLVELMEGVQKQTTSVGVVTVH